MRYLILICCFISFSLFAQSGDLKTDFGSNGKFSLDIDDLDELVGTIKDDQGNTFFYGQTSDNLGGIYPFDFFFGKMDAFGNLDNNFGNNGILRADFPGFTVSSLRQAHYHSTGIYFIGQGINITAPDTFSLFVGRITLNGQIDQAFADNGFYTNDFLGSYNTAGSVIVDGQDKIVFCGSTTDDQGTLVEYPFVARLNQDGTPDSTFGNTGIVIWDIYGGALIDGMQVPANYDRHGEGGYLSEIIEINHNYFVSGKYVGTAFSQLHFMSITKQGDMNTDFVSYGPQIFQVDPGSNHLLTDADFDGKTVFLTFTTDGSFYNGDHLIQAVDTTGVLGNLTVIDNPGYDMRTHFVERWNNKLFIGGYSLNESNAMPGYLSDDYLVYCLDDQAQEVPQFSFYETMGTGDELGAEDIILHDQFGVIGGYMNNVIDSNITDLAFMAFQLDPDLELEEENLRFEIHPNPTGHFLNITGIGHFEKFEISDSRGKLILTGPTTKTIDLSPLEKGVYNIHIQTGTQIISRRFIKQ